MADQWSRLGRAARNAAYDNVAATPGSLAYIQRQQAAAAALRARRPDHLDIPYGLHDRTRFDLFPARSPAAPCLVFIHGGYWQRGSRDAVTGVAQGPLEAGWSVAMPGYPLAPDVTLSGMLSTLQSALDWLKRNGPQHGIAGPLIVGGHSAGGHLAALLLEHPAVVAGLAISGIFELGPIRDTNLDVALQLTDHEIDVLSPLRRSVVAKPLAIAYGTAELEALVADSRDFHARRSGGHAPGALIPIARANHFDVLEALQARDGALTRALIDVFADTQIAPVAAAGLHTAVSSV